MKFSEYDTVMITDDYESEGLKKGDLGAVIMVYTEPNEAYEVEFVDDRGQVKAQLVLLPDKIEKYKK